MNAPHRWQFFRAGAVDQVALRDGDDLLALSSLDQKLWVALAMPTVGVDVDAETLALLDTDGDGRIRARDVLEAVAHLRRVLKSPGDVLLPRDPLARLPLAPIAADARLSLQGPVNPA